MGPPQDGEYATRGAPRCLQRSNELFLSLHVQSYVHKIMRSYDKEGTGLLTPEQLKAAMGRLRLGITDEEQDRAILRVGGGGAQIPYSDFIKAFEMPDHVGSTEHNLDGLARAGISNNMQTAMPWQAKKGKMCAWNWERKPQGLQAFISASTEGSYEQQVVQPPTKQMHTHRPLIFQLSSMTNCLSSLAINLSLPISTGCRQTARGPRQQQV